MNSLKKKYNQSDRNSILNYAQSIQGYSLHEYYERLGMNFPEIFSNKSNKGILGNMIEEYFFGYKPNNSPEADFKDAGMELKVTPLRVLKNGDISVKERLVISKIDYVNLINESWDTNTLVKKIKYLLLMFYLHEKGVNVQFLVFKLICQWSPSSEDLKVIRRDWEFIVGKVREGKAHELSEGDTHYLGACTKSANAKKLTKQPNNSIGAKPRAFSFKRSYIQEIYNQLQSDAYAVNIEHDGSFEDVVLNRFQPFVGKSLETFMGAYSLDVNRKAKHFVKLTVDKAIKKEFAKQNFGDDFECLDEFKKSGIKIKTIVLQPNGNPKESMSFPRINYMDIASELWEESTVRKMFENRYLFVVLQATKAYKKQSDLSLSDIVLKKVMFWNMPESDLDGEYKKLWEDTQSKILNGNYSNFMGASCHKIGHIRPKGRNSFDLTTETPQGVPVKKYCFWLNASYIAEQVSG